jgi:hypothetical protein
MLTSSVLSLLLILTGPASGQKTAGHTAGNPNDLVRRVIANELKSEQQDHSHWTFRLTTHKPNGQTEVDEVVETKDGDLKRPLLINGRKPSSEEQEKSDKEIRQLVQDPSSLEKARKDENEDTERSQQLLKMLPDAFKYTYGRRRGDSVELKFVPNPSFHPETHEAEVFHAMQGTLWLNTKQDRLEEINGRLMREVKFGGGILGHLDQGGTFAVKQARVAPGYWELTLLNVEMHGKALFFKTIGVQQHYTRTNFKQVPDDLSVAKAAEMLQGQTATAENKPQK